MIGDMYITSLPIILAGILNMIFTKTPFYQKHKRPIDGFVCLWDHKRLFGDNKTWIGFISMIVCSTVIQVLYGAAIASTYLEKHNELYNIHPNRFLYNLLIGFLFGFIYMLFELPNSFLKRRLDIAPGTTKKSLVGALFLVVDLTDSLIGVMFVIYIAAGISFLRYLGYLFLGAVTHAVLNALLYLLKIRRNF